jgi:beta-lactamase class A
MSIFKRAVEEELDLSDEEMDDEEKEGSLRRKKIRDLKPENKKKRKEPTKPWTKKERFLILYVLAGSIFLALILFASARGWKLPGLPKIKLPSFEGKTIIITANRTDQTKADKIMADFKDKTKNLSGEYTFYYIRLSDGFAYGIDEKEEMQAASLIKLPVFATLYREAEAGAINLDEKYSLKSTDKVAGSGSLYSKPAGTQLTYRELARYMGKESDNTAFNILRKKLGDSKITETINDLGMSKTSLSENSTSPYDIAIFFKKLWLNEIMSGQSRDEILGYLTDTIYEDWLGKGITGIKVAHKYGSEVHVVNDAGIVLSDKPFVLVILTKGIIEKEANAALPELAKMIFEGQKN